MTSEPSEIDREANSIFQIGRAITGLPYEETISPLRDMKQCQMGCTFGISRSSNEEVHEHITSRKFTIRKSTLCELNTYILYIN